MKLECFVRVCVCVCVLMSFRQIKIPKQQIVLFVRCVKEGSDKKKHKCLDERQKPASEKRGAVQCNMCLKWFQS